MADQELVAKLRKDVKEWDESYKVASAQHTSAALQNSLYDRVQVDLSEADLSGVDPSRADLRMADLATGFGEEVLRLVGVTAVAEDLHHAADVALAVVLAGRVWPVLLGLHGYRLDFAL